MALSILLPPHDSYVKEEELDDIEFSQESPDPSGLMTTDMSPSLQSFILSQSREDVKEEVEDRSNKEEEDRALLQGLMSSVIPASVLIHPSDAFKLEDESIKEEPIDDSYDESLHLSREAPDVTTMTHPGFGIDALLSLAAGQGHALGLQHLLSENAPKEEIDDVTEKSSPSPEMSSTCRKTIKVRSPDSGDDEWVCTPQEDLFHIRNKRGRPRGLRYSEEEVASDPKKRRQAHNREAALRYRERKRLETWEKKNIELQLEHKNACLTEAAADLTLEVQKWRRRCLNAFSFYPMCNFEERWALPSPTDARREISTSESQDSAYQSSDQFELDQCPSAKFRAKKREDFAALKQEEETLNARNNLLRTEARQLYIDIIDLRNNMGFSKARTSADKSLHVLLSSTHYSSIQISDILENSQS